ncbi:hypothetical protein G6R29_06425 [Fructobacillus sp. M2-14]|uniref:Leucine-rich repeat domain-containing protein n=1 Tax=Fructobacillus broussonetiae TaxID=2713173 RepID=A0ABS5R1I9_9LACO|nr:leucine-rich repeat domain-containing protein [Fructobacillus broussonetiae]MBS9339236.1 hypothetical protein [Fructobacillus broussonetiae]
MNQFLKKSSVVLLPTIISSIVGIGSNNFNASADQVTETSLTSKSDSVDAWMPDKNLQSAFRNSLGIDSNASFTKDDLLRIKKISLSNASLSSWNGIEYATNLEELTFVNVSVPEKTVFADLTKKLPNLQKVGITNSNIIGNMFNNVFSNSLKEIDFSNNYIQNLDFLKTIDIPNLESVKVSNNQIENVSGLSNITQKFPNLSYWEGNNNKIFDFTPLAGLKPSFNNPPQGYDQTISRSINLLKPAVDNQTYNIKNIVKTAGIDSDSGQLTSSDISFETSTDENDDNSYNAKNNTVPFIIKSMDSLPNEFSYRFN